MKASIIDDKIVFNLHFVENDKAKSCGAKFHPTSKKWQVKASKLTAAAVVSNFRKEDIDPAIIELAGAVHREVPPLSIDPNAVLKGVALRPRQLEGIHKAWPKPNFALFWVMGAGKTLSSIVIANLRRSHGMIDRLLIICPTSIKGMWSKEFNRYSALPHHLFVLEAGGKVPTKWDEFPIMVVGVEALSQGGAFDKTIEFVKGGRCMSIIDESSTIKNHDKARTERSFDISQESVCRMILTGTSVTQGVQDMYAQMRFVDPTIIGELSYYSFRNKYCIMGGFESRKIVGYRNLEVLFDKVRPYCDVVRKKDLKDLPEKMYQIREVKASPLQVRMCKELARDMMTEYGTGTISVQNSLEALLRFQQISGGFDPEGQPLPTNPKMDELISLLDEFEGKAIIWARYLPEIAGIAAALEKVWPGSTMTITGAVPPPERQPMVDQFEASAKQRFLVVNQQTCGKGLTVLSATLSVYYSNTFSLEDRMQSEDRNHRIGQKNNVTYVDLVSDLKVDRHVTNAIGNKMNVAEYVANGLKVSDIV